MHRPRLAARAERHTGNAVRYHQHGERRGLQNVQRGSLNQLVGCARVVGPAQHHQQRVVAAHGIGYGVGHAAMAYFGHHGYRQVVGHAVQGQVNGLLAEVRGGNSRAARVQLRQYE